MRIVIASSGAGGHLAAALSIGEALRERVPDIEVFFLSSDYRIAKRLVEEVGFRYFRIYARSSIWGQICSFIRSGYLFGIIRPSLVIGTGGFASIGIVFWSWLFRVPRVLHEQNVIPGRANRLLAPLADKILVSFPESKRYFKRYKCRVTGMPLRFKDRLNKQDARTRLGLFSDRFTILIMGGSLGAHSINQLIIDAIEKLTDYKDKVQFVHLTGTRDYEIVKEAYMKRGFKAYVEDFSRRMDVIYSSADMVISRAGSSSISEITFFGLPAILIPYPYSRDKHQLKNAQVLADVGAAVVITDDRLTEVLTELINEPERLERMARQSKSLSKPDAAQAVVEELVNV